MSLSFGKRLQLLRKEKKWTQDELGKRIGVHGRSIGKYEVNLSFPTRKTLKKLAEIFEVSIEYFLAEEENNLASVIIRDKELLQYFLEVDQMDEAAKNAIKAVLEAMIAREKERK